MQMVLKNICLIIISFLITFPCYANYAVVDFSKPSTERRFCIYRTTDKLFCTYVAHGSRSGIGSYAVRFSNQIGSRESSLGVYLIGQAYEGRYGIAYKLYGLSQSNSNAYRRQIVLHRAPYIGYGRVGNSWGCLAIPEQDWYTVTSLLRPGDKIYARD